MPPFTLEAVARWEAEWDRQSLSLEEKETELHQMRQARDMLVRNQAAIFTEKFDALRQEVGALHADLVREKRDRELMSDTWQGKIQEQIEALQAKFENVEQNYPSRADIEVMTDNFQNMERKYPSRDEIETLKTDNAMMASMLTGYNVWQQTVNERLEALETAKAQTKPEKKGRLLGEPVKQIGTWLSPVASQSTSKDSGKEGSVLVERLNRLETALGDCTGKYAQQLETVKAAQTRTHEELQKKLNTVTERLANAERKTVNSEDLEAVKAAQTMLAHEAKVSQSELFSITTKETAAREAKTTMILDRVNNLENVLSEVTDKLHQRFKAAAGELMANRTPKSHRLSVRELSEKFGGSASIKKSSAASEAHDSPGEESGKDHVPGGDLAGWWGVEDDAQEPRALEPGVLHLPDGDPDSMLLEDADFLEERSPQISQDSSSPELSPAGLSLPLPPLEQARAPPRALLAKPTEPMPAEGATGGSSFVVPSPEAAPKEAIYPISREQTQVHEDAEEKDAGNVELADSEDGSSQAWRPWKPQPIEVESDTVSTPGPASAAAETVCTTASESKQHLMEKVEEAGTEKAPAPAECIERLPVHTPFGDVTIRSKRQGGVSTDLDRADLPPPSPVLPQEDSAEAETEAEDEPQAEKSGEVAAPEVDASLPSIGSAKHASGTCKRCCFFPKDRCKNGYDCGFCHFPHEKRRRTNRRLNKFARQGQDAGAAAAADDESDSSDDEKPSTGSAPAPSVNRTHEMPKASKEVSQQRSHTIRAPSLGHAHSRQTPQYPPHMMQTGPQFAHGGYAPPKTPKEFVQQANSTIRGIAQGGIALKPPPPHVPYMYQVQAVPEYAKDYSRQPGPVFIRADPQMTMTAMAPMTMTCEPDPQMPATVPVTPEAWEGAGSMINMHYDEYGCAQFTPVTGSCTQSQWDNCTQSQWDAMQPCYTCDASYMSTGYDQNQWYMAEQQQCTYQDDASFYVQMQPMLQQVPAPNCMVLPPGVEVAKDLEPPPMILPPGVERAKDTAPPPLAPPKNSFERAPTWNMQAIPR